MRVIRCALILICVLTGVRDLTPVAHAQKMTYGVKVMVAKAAELANAKTYSWTVSQPSPDKTVDAQIVAAVDRELSALGFTKVASGPGDVLATYASTRRTDVNLKGKANKSGARPAYRGRDPRRGPARPREPGAAVSGPDRHPDHHRARQGRNGDQRGGDGDVREIPGAHRGEALNRSSVTLESRVAEG